MYTIFLLYMEKGGVVNIIIAFVCFIALYIGLGKLFTYLSFRRSKSAMKMFLKINNFENVDIKIKKDWLINYFLKEYKNSSYHSYTFFYNRFREMLLQKVSYLENGLDAMSAWVSVAPLLGLLGTVVGMVKTFSIITEFGVGNPNLLSEGISVALLTTQSGLIVAFPCLLFHNYLLNKKNIIVRRLIADSEKILNMIEKRN